MYSRIVKNNQVTYGMPFQVRIPISLQNIKLQEELEETEEIPKELEESESPEYILDKAREEASLIIKEAEYEALRIIEEAQSNAEGKARKIEEEAWQKGYGEGNEAAQSQYEGIIREAEDIRESAREEHNQVIAGMETEIISMVLDIAKKVIGNELAVNKENMLYLVKQTLESCQNKNSIILKVSPEDYEFISENKDKLLAAVEGIGEIELKQDLSFKAGACLIETPFGNVNAGVETRLRKIEEAFMEILEGK